MSPLVVFQRAHGDWIFDLTWIDDQFVVSGSRDGSLALWRVTEEMIEEVTQADVPSYLFTRPLWKKPCKNADKVNKDRLCYSQRSTGLKRNYVPQVRALCYNHQRHEVAVISLNGYIHCWNALRFKQVRSSTNTGELVSKL